MDDAGFPLVPRHRLVGLPFGTARSARRGAGSDVAGSRPYRPGDEVTAIDWYATARLSAARGADEFVVRERYADEAPRVVVVRDRRPAMGLYPDRLPWLSKPRAVARVEEAIRASAIRARALVGSLEIESALAEPRWSAPRSPRTHEERAEVDFRAPEDNVELALEQLGRLGRSLPPGTFVFVLSDFLVAPPAELWLRLRAHGWDLVPVVVQDPVWEASFPPVGGVAVPVLDPASGRRELIRVSEREAEARREANERRLSGLVGSFVELGLDPVVISSSDADSVLRAFLEWAEARTAGPAGDWRSRA